MFRTRVGQVRITQALVDSRIWEGRSFLDILDLWKKPLDQSVRLTNPESVPLAKIRGQIGAIQPASQKRNKPALLSDTSTLHVLISFDARGKFYWSLRLSLVASLSPLTRRRGPGHEHQLD